MTGMRDKPRRSGRGRIAPGSLSEPCQTMLLRESCRESELPPGRGKVTPAEIRAAKRRHSAQEPSRTGGASRPVGISGLQAGEGVKEGFFPNKGRVFLRFSWLPPCRLRTTRCQIGLAAFRRTWLEL